ncbi:subtilase-type protease inhibitor [Streptomyces albipurpureus]|uniref:Subtilase-type protease inhibitor n=1 Tax=Streptomyces albipurpureus TaxID=2897419 RepID=A0ABT0V1P0_9ACTN|nr:subtilase-type protease inhibitor [Streptomyces sp. CWNU-1]MCM2393311.1 subtilase-type protease inhibitor [Streptomyces sp. CWNU-1]
MRRTRGMIAVTAAVLLSGAATSTASATQPTSASGLYAPSALVLTIAKGTSTATATVERAVTLSCAPTAGGTHPASVAACGELDSVDGEFTELPSALAYTTCTRQWDPVTAAAHGVWRGQRIAWSATYNNGCEMVASLGGGSIFAF